MFPNVGDIDTWRNWGWRRRCWVWITLMLEARSREMFIIVIVFILRSILSTFDEELLRRYSFAKKSQSQTTIREKLWKALLDEKGEHKMLMKSTPCCGWRVGWSCWSWHWAAILTLQNVAMELSHRGSWCQMIPLGSSNDRTLWRYRRRRD